MRKFFVMVLALVMVLSLSAAAFAAEPSTDDYRSEAKTADVVIKKLYTLSGAADTALYPAETLTFTSTPGDSNPDKTVNLTVEPLEVKGNSDQKLTIKLPVYSKVGTYQYTIQESTAQKMQGVVYTEAEIAVTVLVTYNYGANKLDTKIVLSTSNGANGKVDTFENQYNLGTLTLRKDVTGNLGNKDAYFDIHVTFTAEKEVASDISVTGGSYAENPGTIGADQWKAETTEGKTAYTCTKLFKLRDGETLTFANVPQGVTYAVVEDAKHGLEGGAMDPNSAADTDYTVTYTNGTGEVETAKTTAIIVTNDKSTDVPTGVSLDSVPYILMLTAAAAGLMVLLGKKRYEI